jgi:signal transduction histidine kinase
VYPGSSLGEEQLDRWRAAFSHAISLSDLEGIAATEISTYLRIHVVVAIGREDLPAIAEDGNPVLLCVRRQAGWRCDLIGWEAAPPGPRHVAQLFGTQLAEAVQTLEQAIAFVERERLSQKQARLAELGALAATVAHDIRNPLNIIAMAAAGAPPEIRSEISHQTARISQLASDLLDYAKPWRVDLALLDLGDHVRALAARYDRIEVGSGLNPGLTILADAHRLTQAMTNLFDNAVALRAGNAATRIAVDAETGEGGAVRLHFYDDGPGIPEDIRATIFKPFVSRSLNGTGLGLAIVAKIMEAHGGAVSLTEQPGWTTCFTLEFPAMPS